MAASKTPGTCDQCKSTGLPLLPVRYAVVPKDVKPGLPGWASGERVKDVALGEDFAYALRTVREGYLYLFYSKNARGSNQWECYTVWADGCLHKQADTELTVPSFAPTFQCSREGHNPLSMHYLVIEKPEKCGTTWIAFSDHKWSQETVAEYQKNVKLRDARMQKIEPAAMATGTMQAHGAIAEPAILNGVLEYSPDFDVSTLPFDPVANSFSEEDGSYKAERLNKLSTRYPLNMRKGDAEKTVKHMKQRGKESTPHVIALWDAIGIVHELNGFRNDAAGWLKKYGDERELQITALNAIDGTKRAFERKLQGGMSQHENRTVSRANFETIMRVKPNPRGWPDSARWVAFSAKDDLLKHGPNMGYVVLPQEQINKDIAQNWEKYEAKLDKVTLDTFRKNWNGLLEKADTITDRRTQPLVNWLEAQLFIDSLEDFHPKNIEDGVMFEDAIGEAIFGMGSSKVGQQKIDAWVKGAKASIKGNLLWRAVALNQQEGIEDVDAALALAIGESTPLTVSAWNIALANLKNLQRLADTYKKAQSVYDGNLKASGSSGSKAFGVRLKPIQTRDVDRIVITVGDAIFRKFRIDKVGDFVSEKIIQHIFCIRAMVDPMDSLRLVAAQAKEQKLANAEILRRFNTTKGFLGMDPPEGQGKGKGGTTVPRDQHTASLAEAWEDVKKDAKKGPAAIKDARLAVVVMLIESGNFAKLYKDSKGDAKARAMIVASGMSITAAVLDIASVPAKNIWGSEAATYQKLKLFGGLLSGFASVVGAGVDFDSTVKEYQKEHTALVLLYGMKSLVGGFGGVLAGLTAFSYGAGVIYKISGRTVLAQTARAAGTVATRIIAARILMMSVGAWITFITIGLQGLIWIVDWLFTPNALEDWCKGCAFGPKEKRKSWTPQRQMEEFDKALVEVL